MNNGFYLKEKRFSSVLIEKKSSLKRKEKKDKGEANNVLTSIWKRKLQLVGLASGAFLGKSQYYKGMPGSHRIKKKKNLTPLREEVVRILQTLCQNGVPKRQGVVPLQGGSCGSVHKAHEYATPRPLGGRHRRVCPRWLPVLFGLWASFLFY